MTWINIKDEAPISGFDILIVIDSVPNRQQAIAWYEPGEGFWVDGAVLDFNKVTHWMPLPEYPEVPL